MEKRKSKQADLERRRWIGFVLGLIVSLSVFFVAMEYRQVTDEDNVPPIDLSKSLVLDNLEMLPAIDQTDLATEQNEEKPTTEDLLNLKRSNTPNLVQPKEVGSMESNDTKTAAPKTSETYVVSAEASLVVNNQKEVEEAKKETNKMTDVPSDEQQERTDEKIKKKILSETPTPPEGWSKFMKWLTKNIKYPEQAHNAADVKIVSVTFVVAADGSVDNIKVKGNDTSVFASEVLRVVKTMGKWTPGKEDGKPCRAMIEIPIVFSL
ncbi:MAG: TonB family protein [Prevotella sp.]|nr:TonB family protein [Prevotella sp.]MDD7273181.1 TonB family protein [Prevotellaceae bacterium]MDY3935457.1 TonB family protein [Prevotella sp.]MDY4218325.1 TonB family protein [Prevotella sp.]